MLDDKSAATANYMLRHYLTANITDPLSNASRGNSEYTQYFTGTNTAGQINYLERKPLTGGRFSVYVSDVEKTETTHYTINASAMTITWTGFTPPVSTDNIKVVYSAIKPWIYDDNPREDTTSFPRVSVLYTSNDRTDTGQGIYTNYTNSPGQYLLPRMKIIVRDRRNSHPDTYTYMGLHAKNYDLVLRIAKEIIDYLNEHEVPPLWKFWRWKVVRDERIMSEEDFDGIIRHDVTLDCGYYEGEST